MKEKLQNTVFFLFRLSVTLNVDLPSKNVIEHVTIYKQPKFERDSMKNDREIGGRRWWERRKISTWIEKNIGKLQTESCLSLSIEP